MKFQKGQSGNPAGRPKGARSKLAESFFGDFLKTWEEGGLVAMKAVRDNDPSTYLRVAASIMPKDVNLNHDVSDAFAKLWSAISEGDVGAVANGVDQQQGQPKAVH